MDYILVTPAFNEEKYIGRTIESVLSQTIMPIRWAIVDDGSTDQTADIIQRYAREHSWIEYVHRTKEAGQSYYGSNVYAIQKGLEAIQQSIGQTAPWQYIAILDADITLPDNYYQQMERIFASDQQLGIVSGNCADNIDGTLVKHLYDRRSCAKAIMVFRRACYEAIGGFVPMQHGGEDTIACFAARKQGWKTWAQHELLVSHNKPLGTGPSSHPLKIRFRQGACEFFIGSHPLFVILKSLRRCLKEPPRVTGGLARMTGFLCAHFMREKRQIPGDLVKYIRKEQIGRVFTGNRVPTEFQINEQE